MCGGQGRIPCIKGYVVLSYEEKRRIARRKAPKNFEDQNGRCRPYPSGLRGLHIVRTTSRASCSCQPASFHQLNQLELRFSPELDLH